MPCTARLGGAWQGLLMNACLNFRSGSLLYEWMHDTPHEKLIRFPIFTASTPQFIVQEAARRFKRMAHYDHDNGLIVLEKRRA